MPLPGVHEPVSPGERSGAPPFFLLKADVPVADERLRELRAPGSEVGRPGDEALLRAVAATVGVAPVGTRALGAPGTFHWVREVDLEDGRRVVVRAERLDDLPASGLRVDARVSELAHRHGIPVARCLGLDTSGTRVPFDHAIFERLPGEPLARHDADEDLVLALLPELGVLLARVHEIRLEGAGPVQVEEDGAPEAELRGGFASWPDYLRCRLDEHVRACRSIGVIDGAAADAARAAFAPGTLQEGAVDRLLHGDPGSHNVICSGPSISGLVDWEDALVGDPLFEVASWAGFHPERRWPSFFRGYFGASRLPAGQESRFWRYFLRIALARTVVRHRFGIVDPPDRPPASSRIGRALRGLREAGGVSP